MRVHVSGPANYPVVADFTGAGRDSFMTVWNQVRFWTLKDATGALVYSLPWGLPGDFPMGCQFNLEADNVADRVVVRTNPDGTLTWYTVLSNGLGRVESVHVLEEVPGLHWIVLPACHRGCETRDVIGSGHSVDSCCACGKPFDGQPTSARDSSPARPGARQDRLHEVDEFIVRRVQGDAGERDRLVGDPTAYFAEACRELTGTRPEEHFGIKEVRVRCETDRLVYVVLVADHTAGESRPPVGTGARPARDRGRIVAEARRGGTGCRVGAMPRSGRSAGGTSAGG